MGNDVKRRGHGLIFLISAWTEKNHEKKTSVRIDGVHVLTRNRDL
jgi:hypothetical protein